MFLVAEIWRSRTRSKTVRLFSTVKDAYRYYKSLSVICAHIWEIKPDADESMVPLSGRKLEERLKEEEDANE